MRWATRWIQFVISSLSRALNGFTMGHTPNSYPMLFATDRARASIFTAEYTQSVDLGFSPARGSTPEFCPSSPALPQPHARSRPIPSRQRKGTIYSPFLTRPPAIKPLPSCIYRPLASSHRSHATSPTPTRRRPPTQSRTPPKEASYTWQQRPSRHVPLTQHWHLKQRPSPGAHSACNPPSVCFC
jgi:hypothetical protein